MHNTKYKILGVYNPIRFHIRLFESPIAFEDNDIFEPKTEKGWGLLFHEYWHYIQNISSPSAIAFFMNSFRMYASIARNNLKSSGHIDDITKIEEVKDFFTEYNALYSPPKLQENISANKTFEIIKNSGFNVLHVLIKDKKSHKYYYPLNLTLFAESNAKALQVIMEYSISKKKGMAQYICSKYPLVKENENENENFHYSLLVYIFADMFNNQVDPVFLALIVSDICLSSKNAGITFSKIYNFLKKHKNCLKLSYKEDYFDLRKKLNIYCEIETYLRNTLKDIEEFEKDIKEKEVINELSIILSTMKKAIKNRLEDPCHFVNPFIPPRNMLDFYTELYSAPHVHLAREGYDNELKVFNVSKENNNVIFKAFEVMNALGFIVDILRSKNNRMCDFFYACNSKHSHYCKNNPLMVPSKIVNGKKEECPISLSTKILAVDYSFYHNKNLNQNRE